MNTLIPQSTSLSESVPALDLRAFWRRSGVALAAVAAFACATPGLLAGPAGEEPDAVAISSRASPDYVRPVHADGTPAPETFAFAKGGLWKTVEAGTHDDLDFLKVARTMAVPLANQH